MIWNKGHSRVGCQCFLDCICKSLTADCGDRNNDQVNVIGSNQFPGDRAFDDPCRTAAFVRQFEYCSAHFRSVVVNNCYRDESKLGRISEDRKNAAPCATCAINEHSLVSIATGMQQVSE